MESSDCYLARLGTRGECVTVHAPQMALQRGDRIVCRTQRGLEIGKVLCATDAVDSLVGGAREPLPVRSLRRAGPEDDLLWSQLLRWSEHAAQDCQSFLRLRGYEDVLLEVEPLLDGRTLVFHFLGEPSPAVAAQIEALVQIYQARVANSEFARAVQRGCGPECGSPSKMGCGSGDGCKSCAASGGCPVQARSGSSSLPAS